MKQTKPKKEDKIVIGNEWNQEDNPSLICSWCQCGLIRLVDRSGLNPSYYCNRCSISYDPDQTEIRKKSKLGTQREEIEPAVTSIGFTPDVALRKPVELRGGFAQLAKKGTIRFTSYHTTEKT